MAGKNKNKNGNGNSQTGTAVADPQTDGDIEDEGTAEGEGTGEGGETTAEGTPRKRRGGRGQYTKNFVRDPSFSGEGRIPSFPISDSESIAAFVTAFGDMGPDFDGGYETHFNNDGPLTRKGVVRMSNFGKAKSAAVFLDCLAADAALAGSNHDLPANRSPEQAEAILVSMHEYLGTLIERKRAEIGERNLAAAAKVAGVSVEALRALKNSTAANA